MMDRGHTIFPRPPVKTWIFCLKNLLLNDYNIDNLN